MDKGKMDLFTWSLIRNNVATRLGIEWMRHMATRPVPKIETRRRPRLPLRLRQHQPQLCVHR
jgi:hypothetical protein